MASTNLRCVIVYARCKIISKIFLNNRETIIKARIRKLSRVRFRIAVHGIIYKIDIPGLHR